MNWLNQLLFKPSGEQPEAAAQARLALPAVPSAAELERLRAALGAAPDDPARAQAEREFGRALALAAQMPREGDGATVWSTAICEVAEKTLSLDWLAHRADLGLLAEVAQQGRHAEVRLAAALRIEDGATLEVLARSAKGRDKAVYRHCAEVLRARRQARARQEHGARLAESLRALLATTPLSVSRLLELERELKEELAAAAPTSGAVADDADSSSAAPPEAAAPDALAECQALCDAASRRVRREAEQARALQALQTGLPALAALLDGAPWPGAAGYAAWLERWQSLRSAGADLPDWPGASTAVAQARQGLEDLRRRLDELAQEGQRCAACEDFLATLTAPLARDDASAAQAWAALPLPQHPELRRGFEERWAALQPAAAPVPAAAAPPAVLAAPAAPARPPIDGVALRTLIQELEDAVDQGQLGDADGAAKRIKSLLGEASPERRLEARLQRAQARLVELRDWAKWGATKQREQLIEAAQALLTGAPSVDHVSVAVPALRKAWKQLNSQGPASKAQWDTFDAALEQAYVPVAAQRAEEAQRRAQARAHKEALLAQWEAWLAALDWTHADYAMVEKQAGEWLAQWRSAPHGGFRDERQLRKRLEVLRAGIDERLAQARAELLARRRELIAAALALGQGADLRHAIGEVKALQERWRAPPGAPHLPRGEEQKLWRAFRAACDAVFAQRDAQRNEEAARRQQQTQARVQLLEAFTAVLEGSDVGQVKRALAQFLADWRAAAPAATPARAGGGAGAAPLDAQERAARALQQRARQRIDELERAAYRQRLEQAPAGTAGAAADETALAQGRQQRERLLLDLEIALNLASPASSAEARRRRQLEQLQNRFKTGAQPAAQPEQLLKQWHAIAAATDPDHERRLAAVIDELVARRARA